MAMPAPGHNKVLVAVEEHREDVVEHHPRGRWGFEGLGVLDSDALVEIAVAPHAVAVESRNAGFDLERRVAVLAAVHPGGLARRVVRVLVLEEHVLSPVAVPFDLGLLEVLDEQPVTRDIVPVDDKAVIRCVNRPADGSRIAVVGSPGPDVAMR